MDEDLVIEHMYSTKGKDLVVHDGYKFHLSRSKPSVKAWRCCVKQCSATIKIDASGKVVYRMLTHNHQKPKNLHREVIKNQVKKKVTVGAITTSLIEKELSSIPEQYRSDISTNDMRAIRKAVKLTAKKQRESASLPVLPEVTLHEYDLDLGVVSEPFNVDSDVASQLDLTSMTSSMKRARKSACATEVDIQEGSGSLNIEGDPCPSTSNMQFAAPEVEEPEYHPSEAPGVSHMSYIPPGAPGVSHMSYPSDPLPFLPTPTPVAEETSTQSLDTGSGIVKEKPTSTILADVIQTTTTNSTSGSTSGVKIKPIDALQSKNTSGKAREPKPKENVQTSTVDINAKTLESAIQRLETVSNKLTAVSLVDSYDQFGKYISTVLRGLPIKKVKSLKQKIMSQVLEAMAPEESGPPKDVPVNLTSELRSNFRKHVAEQSQSQAANLPQDPTSLGSKIPIRGNMPILFPGIFTPNQPYMVPPGVVVGRASSVTTDAMSSNTLPPPDEAAVKNADGSFMETTVPKPMILTPYGSNQSSPQPARGRKRRKNTTACQAKKIPSQSETTVHNVSTSGDDSSADEPPTSRTDERTNEERDFEMDIEEGKELKRIKEDEDMFETVICGENPSLYIKEEAPDPEEGDGPPRPPSVNPLSTQERHTCHLCSAQFSSRDQLFTHFTTAHPGQAPATGGYYGT